jgi:FkbM family methyltransferase
MFILNFFRKYFVKKKTFDALRIAHLDVQELITRFLALKGAHLQDLWVLSMSGHRVGFFVEFGAYDGMASSNTFILEKKYGWKGIIAEPAVGMKSQIIANRDCKLDFRAVWDKSNEIIKFHEDLTEGYLSVASEDSQITTNNFNLSYSVQTVTLLDLLRDHNAPKIINYISVDIEGSELRVITNFFENNTFYDVKLWTVEHNYRKDAGRLLELFAINGYQVVHSQLSLRDYWFMKREN